MEIKGKVHCLFEQSGTFKNEFKKLGYEAYDYDIQNNFGETDYQIDIFNEIEKAYEGGKKSIFDKMTKDDLIMAFFPCIYFCDAKTLSFKGVSNFFSNKPLHEIMQWNIEAARERERFFITLMKLVKVVSERGLRMIIENPWNVSGETYLQRNFIKPTIIAKNRSLRGDYYVKPTAYWYINCVNTTQYSIQQNKDVKIVNKAKDVRKIEKGQCSEIRSLIHPNYARNFICDFIIGKEQQHTMRSLF